MLQVEDVSVRFGGVLALDSVGFAAQQGAVTGLIGPNGAGKTTLFNVVTGLQSVSGGRVLLDGLDLARLPTFKRGRLGIARTFQRLEVFGTMSARENILVAAEASARRRTRGGTPHILTETLIKRVGLSDVADEPVDVLPTGLARLVELARALATGPRLLLLDEPASGLDEHETAVVGELLTILAREGIAILLVEHDIELVSRVCSEVFVLDFGRLIASGPPADVRDDAAVRAAYLGAGNDDLPKVLV
jgi:branched-chain amino acid transport system ATP-binding protein